MTVLVATGTRHGRPDVAASIDAWAAAFGAPTLVVVGGDRNGGVRSHRGVDKQAHDHVKLRGWPGWACYADWDAGHGAGPERNGRMVAKAGAGAHLLAFPDARSKGTWDCHDQGVAAGLLCVVVEGDWLARLREMVDARERVLRAMA